MEIKREGENIIIKMSSPELAEQAVKSIRIARWYELTKNSTATEEDVNQLAEEVNNSWWEENKSRFQK